MPAFAERGSRCAMSRLSNVLRSPSDLWGLTMSWLDGVDHTLEAIAKVWNLVFFVALATGLVWMVLFAASMIAFGLVEITGLADNQRYEVPVMYILLGAAFVIAVRRPEVKELAEKTRGLLERK
jgi:uncharacterized membrane protein